MADGVLETASPHPDRLETATQSWHVLLVDDDPLVLESTAAMLEDLGHRVTKAGSARNALEALRGGVAADLVMTDQVMPGMTSLELADEVDVLRPGLPVLLASGYAELTEAEAARVPRLSKPFTQAALSRAVADILILQSAGSAIVSLSRRRAKSD